MSETHGFTENAELYAISAAHSETDDLDIATAQMTDVEARELLDVATGTGHTAFYFARKLAHVFAVDRNDEMLAVAEEEADRKSLTCRFLKGLANDLPFDDSTFDFVTSRLAAHHFEHPQSFVAEANRVLRPGGQLLVIDNVIPDGDAEGAAWINAYEKERDSTHVACLDRATWQAMLTDGGFDSISFADYPKTLGFDAWMERMSVIGAEADKMWNKLEQAPEAVKGYLQPRLTGKQRELTLHRLVMVARKG